MAICNDCVHSGICAIQLEPHYVLDRAQKLMRESNNVEHECLSFKDRSRFVELPCKAGDTVYFDNVHIQSARVLAIYIDAEGGMLDLEITAYSDNALGFEKFINKDYRFEDIGKHLFLKKEEAEQALTKQNQSDNTPQ